MKKKFLSYFLFAGLSGLLLISLFFNVAFVLSYFDNYNVEIWKEAAWSVDQIEFEDAYINYYENIIDQRANEYNIDLTKSVFIEDNRLLISYSNNDVVITFDFYNEQFYGEYRFDFFCFGDDLNLLLETNQYENFLSFISAVNYDVSYDFYGDESDFLEYLSDISIDNSHSGYSNYNDSMIGSMGYGAKYRDGISSLDYHKFLLDDVGFTQYDRTNVRFGGSWILDPKVINQIS